MSWFTGVSIAMSGAYPHLFFVCRLVLFKRRALAELLIALSSTAASPMGLNANNGSVLLKQLVHQGIHSAGHTPFCNYIRIPTDLVRKGIYPVHHILFCNAINLNNAFSHCLWCTCYSSVSQSKQYNLNYDIEAGYAHQHFKREAFHVVRRGRLPQLFKVRSSPIWAQIVLTVSNKNVCCQSFLLRYETTSYKMIMS